MNTKLIVGTTHPFIVRFHEDGSFACDLSPIIPSGEIVEYKGDINVNYQVNDEGRIVTSRHLTCALQYVPVTWNGKSGCICKDDLQVALQQDTDEDTTPSYEQLYMDRLSLAVRQRVLAESYLESEDFHKQIQVLKDERDSYKAALASISLFVSAGIGEEDTTAEDYAKRIKDGIAQMVLDVSKS
jgi:hypothetical protein